MHSLIWTKEDGTRDNLTMEDYENLLDSKARTCIYQSVVKSHKKGMTRAIEVKDITHFGNH